MNLAAAVFAFVIQYFSVETGIEVARTVRFGFPTIEACQEQLERVDKQPDPDGMRTKLWCVPQDQIERIGGSEA